MDISWWETIGAALVTDDLLWSEETMEGLIGSAVISRPMMWTDNILPQLFSWSDPLVLLQATFRLGGRRELPTRTCEEVDVVCSVCIDCIVKGGEACKLACNHWFHTQCIKPWVDRAGTCPNCRAVVLHR